ncbi:MAG: hypothetical protein V3V52_02600 [Candidatus Adiutricales bacterium]
MSKGIDHLAKERIWSESVYADCVSADGRTGYMLRLGRYPDQSTSWLWAFTFTPDTIFGYNDHCLACPQAASAVEEPDLVYEQPGDSSALFQRHGSRDNPSGAMVSVKVMAHQGRTAPHGSGTIPLSIEARMRPSNPPWRINPYRSEWIGEVDGTMQIDGKKLKVQGLGHWHEQHQKAPRFQTPFTYISLRGDDLCLVGTATETEDLGHVVISSEAKRIISIDIDPPAKRRGIRVTVQGDERLEGTIFTAHDYSVPIYGHPRPGTIVTARFGDSILSGCVNDWRPPDAI